MLGGPAYSNVLKIALEQQMPGTGNWFLDSEEFRLFMSGNVAILWGMGLRASAFLCFSEPSLLTALCSGIWQDGTLVSKTKLLSSQDHR